jgi:hypothetical protein
MTRPELEDYLSSAGVPLHTWGTGSAKTLDHLLKELDEGECTLTREPHGIVRRGALAMVRVLHVAADGTTWWLREDRQVFRDGRVRRRDHGGASVAEKIKPGEPTDERLAHRAVAEELGVRGPFLTQVLGETFEITPSPSYPGLENQLTVHRFEVALSREQFRPEGYVEHQPDKDTFFIWERV